MTAQLAPVSVAKFFDNNGFPLSFGQLTTYAAGTTTPQATYVDSTQTTQNTNPINLNFRGECNLWLDPTKSYKFLLQDLFGSTVPGWPIDNITIGNANPTYNIIPQSDNLYTLGSQTLSWANVYVGANHAPVLDTISGNIGYFKQTPAENAATVTPVNYSYAPGNLYRYGFLDDGNDHGTALMSAANQAKQTNGAPIYLPRSTNGCLVDSLSGTPIIFNFPVKIIGDEYNRSYFKLSTTDFTLFTFNNGASGSVLSQIQVIGKGAGATQPLIAFNGSSYNIISSCYIRLGGIGVQYQTGGASCFLNSIRDSRIVSNNSVNIDAQAQTNNLSLFNVTFGGGPCATGIRHKDSGNLAIFEGDCEGMTANCIDIDSTGGNTSTGHSIINCDFEGNTCSQGDIRLGNTSTVKCVFIAGMSLSPNAGDTFFVNTQRVDGLTVTNCAVLAGYTTSIYNTVGAVVLTNFRSFGNTSNFAVLGFGGDIYIGCSMAVASVSFTESAGAGVSIDASQGNEFIITVTDNTAFAIGGPNNPTKNQQISITIRNTSGSALGAVSWNAVFKGPPTLWVSPANGFSRSVGLQYNGTNWIQLWQSAADVPN